MHEDVLGAVFGGDETKALVVIEPFNGTCSHVVSLLIWACTECASV